jgi:raffinose/stachyose/melibiose transport system substrate-binding protein
MENILAAFTAENPGITVKFDPTNPPDYNTTLRAQLEGGTGPDLMYLRSYANSRQLFADGFVEPLDAMKDDLVAAYGEANLVPWSTVEGEAYGVPIIAVSHGIYYNKQIFSELGIEIPQTWEQLIAAAQTISDAGYIPFANASGDAWTIAEIVFMNLAPNFIGGREGRLAYLSGERCFNDENAVAAFQAVADIAPFLPDGQEALVYYDSQALFQTGQAAMWMGGSWDIPVFEGEIADFEWGVFAMPPLEGMDRYVTFHLDAGIGVNAASPNKEAAMTFLQWLNGPTFAKMLADELPGFFPIHLEAPEVSNPHAAEFLALNQDAAGTDVRWAWDGLLDGTPDGYTLMQDNAIAVINGEMTPQEAADGLQAGLAEWLPAAQSCGQ